MSNTVLIRLPRKVVCHCHWRSELVRGNKGGGERDRGGPAILSNTVLIRLPRKEIEVCQCYWRSELVTMGDKWGRKKREMCHFIGEMG